METLVKHNNGQWAIEDLSKAGEPLYHIHVSGQRITDKPMSLKDIVAQHGPVKKLESDGKTKLIPHNPEVKKL